MLYNFQKSMLGSDFPSHLELVSPQNQATNGHFETTKGDLMAGLMEITKTEGLL